jgi:2-haloacid dehalogenase
LNSIRACVFDAYGTLLDVHSAVMQNADKLGKCAGSLSDLWRQRQLEYSWTRSMMGRYIDFWQITIEALDFAMQTYKLENEFALKESLLNAYSELSAYPDALDTLKALKAKGYVTAIFSNGNEDMLQGAVRAGKLDSVLDACLSVDELRLYKPDPRVYQMVCDRLNVQKHEVCFVSSNAWDVAGAGSFGFDTIRINRKKAPLEYHFAPFTQQVQTLSDLPALLSQGGAKA